MAGLKEIRRRIKSVQNTQKITRAMKLVSAAKLRKAQEAVQLSQDYSDTLLELLAVIESETETEKIKHPLLIPHLKKRNTTVIVVGGSKGLCGPFNSNLHKFLTSVLKNSETDISIWPLSCSKVRICCQQNIKIHGNCENIKMLFLN